MSTALANASTPFAGLTPGSRQMAIIEANLEGEGISEMDLTRVKTPAGGGTTWEIDNQGNIETSPEIVGILVAIGKRGLLWPFDEIGEEPPVIVTNDLVTGYRVSDKLGNIDATALDRYRIGDRRYDWAALSSSAEFGYGSGKSGAGKKVKESRVLAILRQGETWPMLVTVGPGSLRNFLPFAKRLPDFHYACVVGLKLTKVKSSGGQPYSQIVPRLVGVVSPEQAEVARVTYTEPLKRMFNAAPNGATTTVDAGDDE